MSVEISRVEPYKSLSGDDRLLVNQGSPPITRQVKLSLLASTYLSGFLPSTGVVDANNQIPLTAQIRFAQLPLAATAYSNNLIVTWQGEPPVAKLISIGQLLTAADLPAPANAEYTGYGRPPTSKLISQIVVSLNALYPDWVLVNQNRNGVWVTRKAPVSAILGFIIPPPPPPPPPPPLYYTSWPYPSVISEVMDADLSTPIAGQLWIPPLEQFNADLSTPQSGTLDTVLHLYNNWPIEAINADLSAPLSGSLDVVLIVYNNWPIEAINADLSIPLSGTLA